MRIIRNYDVTGYYPHLMVLHNYTSRNIPSPDVFKSVLDKRNQAKAEGDKTTANALKLVTNTSYGACLNQYNDLYDPLMGRSVCISGQLFLLELGCCLHREVEELELVQINTDGLMIEFDDSQYEQVQEILRGWQERTGFTLEEDSIVKMVQKDVNNYVEVQQDGTVKTKGGYLVRDIAPAGAFNINNNACIVATALKEYFVSGMPVEETIGNCEDIFQFQIIAKAGTKYKEAYHLVDGEKVPVQKVNRVYATADERYGTLIKVHAEMGNDNKIASLPKHCVIDNDNQLTIADVDKTFYIELAKKRINDFMGIKPEKIKKESKPKSVGIIDAELVWKTNHRFPNLACMKISGYYKSQKVKTTLLTMPTSDELAKFDKVFISKVFTDTEVPEDILSTPNVSYGGTGFYYDKAESLPDEIEHAFPDYSLYDQWLDLIGRCDKTKYYTDYSVGYLTRGCFRKCGFCVNRNYDEVLLHSPLTEFLDESRPKICLLDDNFFGYSDCSALLKELCATGNRFQFKQGLDIRLLNHRKASELFGSKYDGDYIFAFDNIADSNLIEKQLALAREYTTARLKFYVFCAYDREDRWGVSFWEKDLVEVFERIRLLMKYDALPYVMRYNRYETSPYRGMYITLARWCNQPSIFRKMSFREMVTVDGENSASFRYATEYESEHPEITPYYDLKLEKESKKMAVAVQRDKVTDNVYQKLIKAREQFLNSDISKTGKNMHLSFKYFELDDIVPTATRIFATLGLIGVVSFTSDTATMTIVNTDNPEESASFVAPFNQISPIISNTGKQATNEMQALGSSITYMRRYLYMMALDICESDSVDGNLGQSMPAAEPPKKQAPATPEQRESVKKELTNAEGGASELQKKQLKAVLKKLREKDPSREEMIAKIMIDSENLATISKADCEKLLVGIAGMLEEKGEKE